MPRREREVAELARRILALDVEHRSLLLAKLIAAHDHPADWSVISRIQSRMLRRSTRTVTRLVHRTVREVRRERRRAPQP